MLLYSATSFAELLKTDAYSNSDHDRLIVVGAGVARVD